MIKRKDITKQRNMSHELGLEIELLCGLMETQRENFVQIKMDILSSEDELLSERHELRTRVVTEITEKYKEQMKRLDLIQQTYNTLTSENAICMEKILFDVIKSKNGYSLKKGKEGYEKLILDFADVHVNYNESLDIIYNMIEEFRGAYEKSNKTILEELISYWEDTTRMIEEQLSLHEKEREADGSKVKPKTWRLFMKRGEAKEQIKALNNMMCPEYKGSREISF